MICAVLALFFVITWRVLDLSHISRSRYFKSMEQTRRSTTTISAKRGTIFDRNFEVLAFDETKITLGVDPYAADLEKDLPTICTLSEILEINARDMLDKFSRRKEIVGSRVKKLRWIPICEIAGDSLYAEIKTMKIRGVYGIKACRRSYPFGREMAHITGFVSRDSVPICGVEKYMNFYLNGQDGYVESEKDGGSRELAQYRKKEFKHKNGSDVVLSIDKNIQKIVYEEIEKLAGEFTPAAASAIVSEVTSGEILALVNYPSYDPNSYWEFSIESMKNLAVCSIYEPASVFKIVAMSFGLEYGLVSEDTIFDCMQSTIISRGRKVSLPNDHTPFAKLNFVEAVRKSSNRASAQVAMMIGEENFYNCVRAYGFGEKAGYGFDDESRGILFPVSKWDVLTVTRLAMGHAIGVVPLQMHYAMSAIANDGILLKPSLFRSVIDGGEKILSAEPIVRRRVISQQTAVRMRKVLHNPEKGTLRNGIKFAGKTGTGQKIIDGKYSHSHHTSSYSGFFPLDTPKIVITVIVDDAKVGSGIAWGSRVSLPAFRSIAERIAQYLDL